MKKLTSWVLGAVLLPFSAMAAQFVEGKHYEVIAEQATAKPEVKEFFSFYCPACFSFESKVQALSKQLPEGVEVKKVHVDFMRQSSPEIQNAMARALLVGKNLGKGNEVANAIFNHIHGDRKAFASEADVKEVALKAGIDGATYDKAIKSFAIVGASKQMKKDQDNYTSRRLLTGVPMFVVNGKYKILNEGFSRENQDKEFSELINYLLSKN